MAIKLGARRPTSSPSSSPISTSISTSISGSSASAVLDAPDTSDTPDATGANRVEQTEAETDGNGTEDVNVDLEKPAPESDPEDLQNAPAPIARSLYTGNRPHLAVDLDAVAREAVERVLSDQAEAALFDVIDGRSLLIKFQDDDLAILKSQWTERNSAGIGKIHFSEFVSSRLRACRLHVGARPIFIRDGIRQEMESLFNEVVTSDQDLLNKIDRHIRPIIESPDVEGGVLRLDGVDPALLEMVSGWYPDKSPAKAISDFMVEAAKREAGLI